MAKNMAKWKKIVLAITALVVFAGYIAAASLILEKTMGKPEFKERRCGVFLIEDANSDIDKNDPKEKNSLFDSVDNNLLYHPDAELKGLKLISLYKTVLTKGETIPADGEEIVLEISADLVKSGGAKIVRIVDGNAEEIEIVHSTVEQRTRENDKGETEAYTAIVFDADKEGYYGVVSARKTAHLAWILALISIAAIIVMFVLLFMVFKTKRDKVTPDELFELVTAEEAGEELADGSDIADALGEAAARAVTEATDDAVEKIEASAETEQPDAQNESDE